MTSEEGGMTEAEMVAELTKLGWTVKPPSPLHKPPRCHVCGAVESNAFFSPDIYDVSGIDDDTPMSEWMLEVVVVTNPGEEGYDEVTRFFCDSHDRETLEKLAAIGFTSHKHGGTAMLEDMNCPGSKKMKDCPHNDTNER